MSPVRSDIPPGTFLPIRPDWLARRHEAALEPDLPIVDPHHHLWDRPAWRYLMPDLLDDLASGHRIVATVFIECQSMYRAQGPEELRPVGEVEFANGVAAMGASGRYGPAAVCAGIVGYADLRIGAGAVQVLEEQLRAAPSRLRGIRQSAAWDDYAPARNPDIEVPPGMLADSRFREGFARLAPLGLSFEAWVFHRQIDEVTDLARAFPETRIVLNHIGGTLGVGPYAGKRDEVFKGWSRSMAGLAECPNVFVKIGGFGMRRYGFGFEYRDEPPSSDDLASAWRPYAEACIEAFGAPRCMFESNFPVDKGSYSYGTFWNACKKLTRGASAAEKADLFRRSAATFYRLALPEY